MKCVALFVCVFLGLVSGFLVENGGPAATSNPPQSNDQFIQNMFNLILNEQTSRLQLQSLVTTLSNKINQLESANGQIQKDSEAKINQTANDMTTKLNALSARLVKMEQINADVSKQLAKEKNNREHLEQLYTDLETRVQNLTADNKTEINTSELKDVESKVASLENMYTSTVYNLSGVTSRLDDLTAQFVNTVGDTNSNQTGNSTNLLVKVNQMETRLGDLTHQYEELKNDSRISDLMILEDKLITMEANLQNLTIDTNYTHLQIVSDDVTNMKKVLKNLTVNEFNQSHMSVGFSVFNPDTSSASLPYYPLKFKNVTYNSGDGYSLRSGIFICKYPGLYFFMANIFRSPGATESFCYLTVNARDTLRITSGVELEDGYLPGSGSIVHHLKKGDTVYLSGCGNVTHMYEYSSYTGFRISN